MGHSFAAPGYQTAGVVGSCTSRIVTNQTREVILDRYLRSQPNELNPYGKRQGSVRTQLVGPLHV